MTTELKTNRTREEWAGFNPYFQGSMRSTAATVVIRAKEDIEALFAEREQMLVEIARLRKAKGHD